MEESGKERETQRKYIGWRAQDFVLPVTDGTADGTSGMSLRIIFPN